MVHLPNKTFYVDLPEAIEHFKKLNKKNFIFTFYKFENVGAISQFYSSRVKAKKRLNYFNNQTESGRQEENTGFQVLNIINTS